MPPLYRSGLMRALETCAEHAAKEDHQVAKISAGPSNLSASMARIKSNGTDVWRHTLVERLHYRWFKCNLESNLRKMILLILTCHFKLLEYRARGRGLCSLFPRLASNNLASTS
jgi:hypothetical protein